MTIRSVCLLAFMVSPVMADRDAAIRAYQQKDFVTAIKEWQALADQGDAEAEFRLGVMYDRGEGVPAQPQQAAKWYRKAAEQGYPQAQYGLGMLYASGRGVLLDYIEAHKWLNLAGANGEAEGAKQRDNVGDKMTPAQIAEAQRLARDWKATPAEQSHPEVLHVGNGVSAPVVLYKIDPDYTEEARGAGLKGTVALQLNVDTTGHASDVRVIRSLGLGLDEKAIEAVNAWKFRPGSKNGQLISVVATIEVNFRLQFPTYPRWRLGRALYQLPDGANRPILTEFVHPKAHAYRVADQNSTVLHFEVDPDGIPRQMRFTVDPEPKVKNDLLTAVKKWRFNPAVKDGMPVSANASFEFVWEENKQ